MGGLALLLAGCGSTPVTTTGPTPVPATLNGNWLLTGSLPFADPLGSGPPNSTFGLAMTFAVQGNQLVAADTVNMLCGAFVSSGSGGVVTGTIASDGSFTAQTAAGTPLTLSTLQIKGTVPAAGATSWPGTYSFTTTNPSCPFTMTGLFTAVRIADVTGTYNGSTTLNPSTGATFTTPQPVTVSFTLQQGAVLTGSSQIDPEVLTGAVQVKGSSCFSSGTASSIAPGGVLGNEFITIFTMDDGSTVNLLADVENAQSTKASIRNLSGGGGKCGFFFTGPFEIVRQ